MSKISIRLTEEEEAALREVAERAGVTVSDLVRACIEEKFPQVSARVEKESAVVSVVREELSAVGKWSQRFERALEKMAERITEMPSVIAKNEYARRSSEIDRALLSAVETQHVVEEAVEEMCRHLQKFCHETVPAQMGRSLETMAKEDLATLLKPLEQGVAKAARQIEICHDDLAKVSWKTRLLMGPLLAGLVAGLVGAGMIVVANKKAVNEAVRYELLGRTVEAKIAECSPKDQAKVRAWINTAANDPLVQKKP